MSSILILDDRPADRELLATLLRYAGYEVREAATGDEALEAARAEQPDLVITDILVPTMNGYEFVRRLRTEPEVGATPVIFCTANSFEGEVKRLAETCSVSHFISKPAEPETILATVGEALGSAGSLELRLLNDKLVEKVGELEAVNAERQRLVGQLLKAHEEERRRIANAVHDDSIQAVGALAIRLGMLVRSVSDPDVASQLEESTQTASLAIERLRHLIFELQPVELETQGLRVALEVYLERARDEDGLEYEIVDRTTRDPAEATRTLLYRMVQEALANVRKHAQASHVTVVVEDYEAGYRVTVQDDGKGFHVEDGLRVRPGHLGLPSMRARLETAGGSLHLESTAGAGATIEIRVPELGEVSSS